MKRAYISSIIFNVLFFVISLACCILALPTLILPRKVYLFVVKTYLHIVYFLERLILGLRYEIRGEKHLPQGKSYLVAAKHQSLYETFKLHLLFDDPAIILKKELLRIPLWGLFLWKSDVIAIDRSTPDAALESIEKGSLRVKEQGRPIVIFPQGTRVHPDESVKNKPYKHGIFRIYETTDLPVIPMATNSGLFWPKKGFFKSSGTAIFKFLPPIEAGKSKPELMSSLEKEIEEHSLSLSNESKMAALDRKSYLRKALVIVSIMIALGFGYKYAWFKYANFLSGMYVKSINEINGNKNTTPPNISGFPGPFKLHKDFETLDAPELSMRIHDFKTHGWGVYGLPLKVETGVLEVKTPEWNSNIELDRFAGTFSAFGKSLTIHDAALSKNTSKITLNGLLDLAPPAKGDDNTDLVLSIKNHEELLMDLAAQNIIKSQMAIFMSAGLNSMRDDNGMIEAKILRKNKIMYIGPFPIGRY